MKKVGILFVVFIFMFCMSALPVLGADDSKAIQQLKGEIQKLMQRLDELEKKQKETTTKAEDAEKKVAEVEKKAEKVEKKALKDRLEFGGEFRARALVENASTEQNFYGFGKPSSETRFRDESSFPLRLRLNAHAEVVTDWVDFYTRLTMNKRFGAWDTSATDPFNKPNSFESSIGHDMNARFERAYMTMNLPWINGKWYIGRLPGMDGAPQRQEGYLFPRPFIDSEIDGTLLQVNAPETALDTVSLPWTSMRLWGTKSEQGKAPTLKQYEAKVREKTGIVLGYLKYQENKMTNTDDLETKADSDAFLAQAQIKVGKDTVIVWDGLTMADWHMPNGAGIKDGGGKNNLDLETNYLLTGVYADTQLLGFQIYGAYYYSHFDVPNFGVTKAGDKTATKVEGQGFPGHLWFAGFNTGDLIGAKHQFTLEFADGSNAWINPFNYRGFRRKGTVLQPQGNFFFDPKGTFSSNNGVAGFYPFNAQVWDLYYDYYFRKNVRFRLGYLDFLYTKHDIKQGQNFSVLGSSKFQHDYWPYVEVNISF